MLMTPDPWDAMITTRDIWISTRRLWPGIAAIVIATTAGAGGMALSRAPSFVAEVTVAALPNPKLQLSSSSIGALLGGAPTTGISPTPYLVAKLFGLRSVLLPLGDSLRGPDGRTALDILANTTRAKLKPREKEELLRHAVSATVDKQTGLVTMRVGSTDSSMSRALNAAILERGSSLYRQIVRAQASGQQEALRERVDSTRKSAQRAEAKLAEFLTSNRLFSGYASAQLTQQRLERDATTAQIAYAQAVADRDGAIARELEVPAPLIVVDPVSQTISAEPRYVLLWALLGSISGSLIAVLLVTLYAWRSATTRRRADSAA